MTQTNPVQEFVVHSKLPTAVFVHPHGHIPKTAPPSGHFLQLSSTKAFSQTPVSLCLCQYAYLYPEIAVLSNTPVVATWYLEVDAHLQSAVPRNTNTGAAHPLTPGTICISSKHPAGAPTQAFQVFPKRRPLETSSLAVPNLVTSRYSDTLSFFFGHCLSFGTSRTDHIS